MKGERGNILAPALAGLVCVLVALFFTLGIILQLRESIRMESRADAVAISAGRLYADALRDIQRLNHALYVSALADLLKRDVNLTATKRLQGFQNRINQRGPWMVYAAAEVVALKNKVVAQLVWNGKSCDPAFGLKRRAAAEEIVRLAAGDKAAKFFNNATKQGWVRTPTTRERFSQTKGNGTLDLEFPKEQVESYEDSRGRKGWRLRDGVDQGRKFVSREEKNEWKKFSDLNLDLVSAVRSHEVKANVWALSRGFPWVRKARARSRVVCDGVSALILNWDYTARLVP